MREKFCRLKEGYAHDFIKYTGKNKKAVKEFCGDCFKEDALGVYISFSSGINAGWLLRDGDYIIRFFAGKELYGVISEDEFEKYFEKWGGKDGK